MAMRSEAPELFQNLYRSDYSAMPADVATGLRNNQLWAGDEVVLEKYGWTAKADYPSGWTEKNIVTKVTIFYKELIHLQRMGFGMITIMNGLQITFLLTTHVMFMTINVILIRLMF